MFLKLDVLLLINFFRMKNIRIIVACLVLGMLFTKQGYGQATTVPVDEDTKLITYKEVVEQEGSIEKLYNTAMAWVNVTYTNPAEATKIRDVNNGKLEIKHRFKVYNTDAKGVKTDAYIINYTLKLEFKPGKYRYIFTDFYTVPSSSKFPLERWLNKSDPQYTPACDDYLAQLNTTVNDMITSLKKGMVPKAVKKDDW